MNKRYLYRAKSVDTGDLVFGSLVYSPKEDEYYIVEHNDEELSWLVYEDTICQCTGIEDDNGYLMFENDEVALEFYGNNSKLNIKYRGGSFVLVDKNEKIIIGLRESLCHKITLINPSYQE